MDYFNIDMNDVNVDMSDFDIELNDVINDSIHKTLHEWINLSFKNKNKNEKEIKELENKLDELGL